MYCIVETTENGEKNCTAVPKCWIRDNYLLWPNKKYDSIKGRQKCTLPSNSWTSMPCKILLDDISEWVEALQQEQFYEYLSSSEGDVIIPAQHQHLQLENNDFNNLMNSINTVTIINIPIHIEEQAIPDSNAQNLSTSCNSEYMEESLSLRKDVNDLKNTIVQQNAKIEVLLHLILSKIAPDQRNNESDEAIFEFNVCKTAAEIENLEHTLRNDQSFKSKLVQKLSTFGGSDATKTCRTIAKFLFLDEALLEFTWGGTSKKKISAHLLKLIPQ